MNENYPEASQQYQPAALGGPISPAMRRLDITLRQNIDERIKQAQAHVAELEATKTRMESSGILDMRIDDIQRAMRF